MNGSGMGGLAGGLGVPRERKSPGWDALAQGYLGQAAQSYAAMDKKEERRTVSRDAGSKSIGGALLSGASMALAVAGAAPTGGLTLGGMSFSVPQLAAAGGLFGGMAYFLS